MLRVRRTGGFAGRTVEGTVDLSGDDARADAVRDLVQRLDFGEREAKAPMPDAFSYTFEHGGQSVTITQHQLSNDEKQLADLALRPDDQVGGA
jgi:hypothetical protein